MSSEADAAATIVVEIAYAEPQRAVRKTLSLPQGTTVAQAILLAAQDAAFSNVALSGTPLGIFGLLVQPDQLLCNGDRLEIYRPLAEDPKLARRRRAARNQ